MNVSLREPESAHHSEDVKVEVNNMGMKGKGCEIKIQEGKTMGPLSPFQQLVFGDDYEPDSRVLHNIYPSQKNPNQFNSKSLAQELLELGIKESDATITEEVQELSNGIARASCLFFF